jgi:hypothetical protein
MLHVGNSYQTPNGPVKTVNVRADEYDAKMADLKERGAVVTAISRPLYMQTGHGRVRYRIVTYRTKLEE